MSHANKETSLKALAIGAVGVVYGDIGTSPLYAMREVFAGTHPMPISAPNVLGILSLVFWSLIFVVSAKYISLIMRADNNGEGGIIALMELGLRTTRTESPKRRWMIALGIFGASLFFADGVITPAISVLSAVEGVELLGPALKDHVIAITISILFILFWGQKRGSGSLGSLFGPVMCAWFAAIGIFGIVNIIKEPSVLRALNPYHAAALFITTPKAAFLSLGGVVLALTGAEALYADMGHFGRKPIQVAWFCLVLPALTLNYFGQGALVLSDAKAIENPFYLLVPSWALVPMILLATAATIIASQAVISGAFSIAKQIMQLGFLPRIKMLHTSEHKIGQIYLPFINWALFSIIVILVTNFKSSTNLGAAYGIAATGTMIISSTLAFVVVKDLWKWHWSYGSTLIALFMTIDIAYLSANIIKVRDGGWIPLLIGVTVYTLMTTWKRGTMLHFKRTADDEMKFEPFIRAMEKLSPYRPEGTAVYLKASASDVPHALLNNLYHNGVLHRNILVVTVRTTEVPHVPDSERVSVKNLSFGFHKILVSYGFKDDIDIPKALTLAKAYGIDYEPMKTSYFLGRDILVPRLTEKLSSWRRLLYLWMFKNSSSAHEYFRIPPSRVIELGTQKVL